MHTFLVLVLLFVSLCHTSQAAPITCSGAELQFERIEDNIGGSQNDMKAALAAKGLKLAEKLVGTGITIVPGSVILDEGTQPGGGGMGGRRLQNGPGRHLLQGFGPPPNPGGGGGGGGGGGSGEATPSAVFTGGAKTFGSDDMAEGIVLSTGNVGCRLCDDESKPGVDASFAWGNAKTNNAVDADFRGWCTEECNRFQDMVSLEFKFKIDVGCKMGIKYVFTSEEWPKYVNPLFADSFAFFIGDSNAQNFQNIALTPQGEAVSIKTVNCVSGSFPWACSNCNLFYDNSGDSKNSCPGNTNSPLGGKGFALKGMTKMMEGEIALSAGTHTIKLVIADARDTEKDSAVFVAAKSMTAAIPMCYTVVSVVCGEVPETLVQPVTKFPSGHPVMTRSNCDGQPTGDVIPGEGKELQGTACGKEAGGSMFYAYDATQSRSGYAKKGKAIVYVVRDSWKRAYLVIELGKSSKSQGYATMKVKLERVTGSPGILVKDDASDDFTWDSTKNEGRFKWTWNANQGDGVVIGPFIEGDGWCLEWTLFEAGGLDSYVFGSYEKGQFVEKVVMTEAVLENGVRLCGCAGTQDANTGESKCQACDKRADGKTCGGGGLGSSGGGSSGGGSSGGGSSGGGSSSGGSNSGGSSSSGSGGSSGSSGGTGSGTNGGNGVDGGSNSAGGGGATSASCSTGVVNAAGDGCDASCSTGKIDSTGNGCEASCTKGNVNSAGDGCDDADAVFASPGSFVKPGTFTPSNDADTNGSLSPSSVEAGGGAGGVIVVLLFLCTFLGVVAFVYKKKKEDPQYVNKMIEKVKGSKNGKSKQKDIEMKNTNGLPPFWEQTIDEGSGYPLYTNTNTGAVQWEKPQMEAMTNPMNRASHGRSETVLPPGWGKDADGNNNKYYYGPNGEVSWEPPAGATGGSTGLPSSELGLDAIGDGLPAGWGTDFDAEGNQYWYGPSGETAWEPPIAY